MPPRDLLPTVLRGLGVLAVAGIPVGAIVAGVGGRLGMLALRVTSGSEVHGVRSDDGFVIGRFTATGTYNLLLVGAIVGVIGAAAYQWVRPWLIGPPWFRHLTVAAASGAVAGSILVHTDGVDFTRLTPTWLAITTFVVLPAVFGAVIGPAVEATERWTRQNDPRRSSRILPIVLVAAFPLTTIPLAVAAAVLTIWATAEQRGLVPRVADAPVVATALRAGYLAIALAGLVALVDDITQLA